MAEEPTMKTPGYGRVLAIDDEEPVVDAIARMLRAEGYFVETATSGASGVKLFEQGLHDLVLTDLRLGDMTGTEVLREVKKIHPKSAVIILTGYATTESAVEAIKLGANDYLTKPVRMSELSMAVRNQMAAVKLSEQIALLNEEVAAERDKLKRTVAELTLMKRLASRMMSALSYFEGFELILNFLVEEVKADVAVIYDLERRTARLSANSYANPTELQQLSEIVNWQAEAIAPGNTCSVGAFEATGDPVEGSEETSIASSLSVTLLQEGRPFALLVAASRSDRGFHHKWQDFANKIAQEASDFLSRVKRSVELQQHWTSAIVEHTIDGLVVMHLASDQFLVNPVARSFLGVPLGQELTLAMLEERLSLKLSEILEELNKPDENGALKRTIVRHADLLWRGQTLYVRLNFSRMQIGAASAGTDLLLVMQDVTQERNVEEMKAKLMSNISHELRTPTAVVKEFISLILDGVAGELSTAQKQYIQIMQSNVERLSRLIENLLTLARSDTGGFTIVLRPVELGAVIDTVAASLTPKLAKKGMKLVVDLPPAIPLIYADRDAVTQVLTNLVENARKYSPDNTMVTIKAAPKGSRVEIAVIDQGYGIPPEEHEAVFKRFHRLVDKNDPRFQEGVGLGLPLVKDLVTRHGGDIWLTSEVGKGSTFFVSLQVAQEDEEYRPA